MNIGLPPGARVALRVARFLRKRERLRTLAAHADHVVGSPHIFELAHRGDFTRSPAAATAALLGEGNPHEDEYLALAKDLEERLGHLDRAFPSDFGVGDGTGEWLYSICRHFRPQVVVEIGVADGRSSAVILSALDAVGSGRLVSVDVNPDAGQLVSEHPRWQLRIHDPDNAAVELGRMLDELGQIDLFFHDAGHDYAGQVEDYLEGLSHVRPGGVFISDDIDWSWAFADLCNWAEVRPVVLGDHWKASGAFVVPPSRA